MLYWFRVNFFCHVSVIIFIFMSFRYFSLIMLHVLYDMIFSPSHIPQSLSPDNPPSLASDDPNNHFSQYPILRHHLWSSEHELLSLSPASILCALHFLPPAPIPLSEMPHRHHWVRHSNRTHRMMVRQWWVRWQRWLISIITKVQFKKKKKTNYFYFAIPWQIQKIE